MEDLEYYLDIVIDANTERVITVQDPGRIEHILNGSAIAFYDKNDVLCAVVETYRFLYARRYKKQNDQGEYVEELRK